MRRLYLGMAAGVVAGPFVGLADAVYVLTSGPPTDYVALIYAVLLYALVGLLLGVASGLVLALLGLVAPRWTAPHRCYTLVFSGVLAGLGAAVAAQEVDRVLFLDRGLSASAQAAIATLALAVLLAGAWLGPILLTQTPFKIVLRPRGTAALLGVMATLSAVFSFAPVAGGDPAGWISPERPQDDALAAGPDVLLVLVDALRPDHLGAYGAPEGATPSLDALAARGIVFEQAIAQATWARGSVASLISSQLPTADGVRDRRDTLDDTLVTLAESLQARGFVTGALFAHPELVRHAGVDQGYDWAPYLAPRFPLLASQSASNLGLYRVVRRLRARRFMVTPGIEEYHQPAPLVLDRAREFVAANRDRRWFLTVHLMDAQPPLQREGPEGSCTVWEGGGAPASGAEDDARLAYREAVARVDDALGSFLDWLDEQGLGNDTLVVLTAPQGIALGEHGTWGTGVSLFDEQVHVPLLVALPGGERGGTRVAAQVRLLDLAPTIARRVAAEIPATWQGADLLASLPESGLEAITEASGGVARGVALREASWKLLGVADPEASATARLYHIAADPGEAHDVAASEPATRERLARLLSARLQDAHYLAEGRGQAAEGPAAESGP
ncbi:MAG: sulfatase [Pseudomonadota bacterium]